jgi:hypothetical protein
LAPVSFDRQGNISISGNLPNVTSFSLDGISTQSVRNGGPNKDLFPSVESIGEFKVNAAGSNAEFAQPTDITVTSKSGGNQFRRLCGGMRNGQIRPSHFCPSRAF